MTPTLVMVGGGGHAGVVVAALRALGLSLEGFVAPEEGDRAPEGVPYLGDEDALPPPGEVVLVNGVGTVVPGGARREVHARLSARGYAFHTVVHPRAWVAESATVGEGAHVMAGALVQAGARVGRNALVNTGVIVEHDVRVGDHVHVASGTILAGDVQVGDGAFVGTGARIIQGLRIGKEALVAAGAVVLKDVPDGVRVYGVPATQRKASE